MSPKSNNLTSKTNAYEKALIIAEIEKAAGHLLKAANALGVSRMTLYRKMRYLKIDPKEYKHYPGCKCGICLPQARQKAPSPDLLQCSCCKSPGATRQVYLIDEYGDPGTDTFFVCTQCYLNHTGKTPGFASAALDPLTEGEQK